MLLKQCFRNKNILILGYSKSGQSAQKLLENIAKNIYVFDKKFKTKILNKNNKIKKNNKYNKNNKNNFILNKNNIFLKENIFFENNLNNILKKYKIHFCIVSPGFPLDSKEIKLLKIKKIRLVSELELGTTFCQGKIFAITGTNGKTTTAHALFHIFSTAKKQCFLCGNVGTPISEIAPFTTPNSLLVVEVSSFQMETTKFFHPYASAFLNLSPDHLDRHKTMSLYGTQKNKINMWHKTQKFFNFDNIETRRIASKFLNAKFFSLKKSPHNKHLNLIKENNLIGDFNNSNLLSATILALCAKISPHYILKANQTFYAPDHRLQLVAHTKNLAFINDSKSTNIASTLAALSAVKGKTVLLLGGSNKDLDFSPLARKEIFSVIGYGETLPLISKAFSRHPFFTPAVNLEDALKKAIQIALDSLKPLTIYRIETSKKQTSQIHSPISILLSPACASFDEFASYKERGEKFCALVNQFISDN